MDWGGLRLAPFLMAKFQYLGDKPETYLFGYTFPIGEPVEVSEPAYIAKLRGNSHFRDVGDQEDAVIISERPRRGRPPKAKA